jgi:hypothetical protein
MSHFKFMAIALPFSAIGALALLFVVIAVH